MLTVLLIDKARFWQEHYPNYADALRCFDEHRGPAFIFDPDQGLLAQRLEEAVR